MTSLFGSTSSLGATTATGGGGLFGSTSSTGGSNLFGTSTATHSSSGTTNLFGNTSGTTTSSNIYGMTSSVNRPMKINSRSTVRQLTTIIPEWKGHFDVAEMILSMQEHSLDNVRLMISQLDSMNERCIVYSEQIKNLFNDIKLRQDKLETEVLSRCNRQDELNLISIKARRLSESIDHENVGTSRVAVTFRIPNHLNVQMSKELLEKVRSLKDEIQFLQNEVRSLKDIDISKASTFIEGVVTGHYNKIRLLGDGLIKLLNRAESALGKDSKKEIWGNLSGETSKLKKQFFEAIGLYDSKSFEVEDTSPISDVKRQIKYLKKFNDAFKESNGTNLNDEQFNIKDILTSTPLTTGGSNLFGASNTTGTTPSTSNIFGTTSSTGGTNLFGGSTGTTGVTNIFGTTSTTQPTTGNLFGGTNTTNTTSGTGSGTNIFGNTTGTGSGTGNLFGGSTATNTTTGTTGSTNLFGTTTGTGSGTGNLFGGTTSSPGTGSNLFGSTANTGAGNLFGNTSGTTTSNTSTGTALAIYQPNPITTLFGTGKTGLFK